MSKTRVLLSVFISAGLHAQTASAACGENWLRSSVQGLAGLMSSYQPSLDPMPKLTNKIYDPQYNAQNPKSHTTWWDERPEGKTLWETIRHAEFSKINGLEVIAARVYEFLGYQTSQPRVETVEGKKVVLRKRMDEWRTINGSKVKMTTLVDHAADSQSLRQLRLAAALLGDRYRIGDYANSAFEGGFTLNEFPRALTDLKQASSAEELMGTVDVAWLPVNHPWHNVNSADIEEFKVRLKGLTNKILERMIATAELGDRELEHQVLAFIAHNRDLMLSQLGIQSLKQQPSPELRQAYEHAKHALNTHIWGQGKEEELRREYLPAAESLEIILNAYIRGETRNHNLASSALSCLDKLDRARLHKLKPELIAQLLSASVGYNTQAASPATERADDFGASVIRDVVIAKDTAKTNALAQVIEREYHGPGVQGLYRIMKKVWSFPDADSGNAYAYFPEFAGVFRAAGENSVIEILLLSLVSAGLDHAEFFEAWLSRGGGYHNSYRINSGVEHGARAIQDFLNMNIPRSELTAKLKLEDLAEILLAMKYDSLGKRRVGPHITPAEAFNLNGATRTEPYNVYDLLREYLIRQLEGLPAGLLEKARLALPPK